MKLVVSSLAIVSGLATAAYAQDTAEGATAAAPTVGAWSPTIRIGIPTTFTDTGVVLGMGDVQLGLDVRASERWYVGGTAAWTLGVDLGSGAGTTTSLRAGGEARYIFHQGEALMSSDGMTGPWWPTRRNDWVGLRGGAQSVNGADGGFAELSIGCDATVTRSFQFGAYLAIGVNVEPATAYASNAMDPAPVSGTVQASQVVTQPMTSESYVTSPFVSVGWDFTFD